MDTGFEDVYRQNGAATDHMTRSSKHNLSTLTLPPTLFHLVRFSYCLLGICSRLMVLATIAHIYNVNYCNHLKFSAKYMDSRREEIARTLCIAVWLMESSRTTSNTS